MDRATDQDNLNSETEKAAASLEYPDVSLRYCDLKGRNLSGAEGMMAWALAGSDLRGAQLPDNFSFDLIKRAKECSKSCKSTFLTILIAAFICWLARLTSTDLEMAQGEAGPNLPFVGTPIDIKFFYILSPVLILAIYIYFHLNLQILWACAVNLPTYFPDGLRIDKKIYPWALIRFSELLVPDFWKHSSTTTWLRVALTGILFWAAVPASLIAYWLHYMNQHSLSISLWHSSLIVSGLLIDLLFVYRFFQLRIHSREETGRRIDGISEVDDAPDLGALAKSQKRWFLWLAAFAIMVGAIASGYTVAVIKFDWHHPRAIAVLNLEGKELQEVDLRNSNLRGANLKEANLCEGKLAGADLSGADLSSTNLRDTNLSGADLSTAKVVKADLRGAQCNDETQFPETLTLVDFFYWSSSCKAAVG